MTPDNEPPAPAKATSAGTGPQKGRGRSLLPAVFGTLATNMGFGVLSLGNVLVTSRSLGPEGRGQVAFLTSIAMLTATLSTFGVEEANANFGGREPGKRPALATNSLVLALLFGGAAATLVAISMVALPGITGETSTYLRWVVLAFVPMLVLQFYLQLLVQADYRFMLTNVASLLGPLINVAVNGLLALLGVLTVKAALATWLAGQAIATAVLVWYVARRLGGFGKPDGALAGSSVRFGAKAHLGRAMKTGNYRLDIWILGAMAGSREVGLYSVAVSWTEALFYLPTALSMVLRPDLVRASPSEAASQTASVFRTATLLTIPLVLLFVVGAPLLCVTTFGDEFRGSVDDLRMLAPGAFGIVALKLFVNALTAQRQPMLANAALAIAFATTVVLDVALIPHLGGLGAAVASSIAYTAGGVAVALIFVRALGGRRRDLVPGTQDLRGLDPRRLAARLRQRSS